LEIIASQGISFYNGIVMTISRNNNHE